MKTVVLGGVILAIAAGSVGCKSMLTFNGKPVGGSSSSSSGSTSSSSDGDSASNSGGNAAKSGGDNVAPTKAAVNATPPPAGKPAEWCEDVGIGAYASKNQSIDEFTKLDISAKLDKYKQMDVAAQFGAIFCTTEPGPDRDKILAVHAKWMKNNNLDMSDFIVLVGLRNRRSWGSDDDKISGVVDQISARSYSAQSFVEADAVGTNLSAYSRYRLMDRCKNSSSDKGLLHDILCTREAPNMAQAFADIETQKEINIETRYNLRQEVRLMQAWYEKTKASLDAQAKEDPGIAKVIEIADATFKEWSSLSPKRAQLLALNEKMEAATRANKNSAFAGCEKETKAAWEEHLKSLKLPKVSSDGVLPTFLAATLDSPEGYLAYSALRMCSAGHQSKPDYSFDFIGSDVIRRGPRTATIANWLANAGQIKFDDRSLKMNQMFGGLGVREGSRWETLRSGVIDKIVDDDGTVTIQFKHITDQVEDCVQSVETNRVAGFDSAGGLVYRHKCVKWGMVKLDMTADPITLGTVMAAGLKPGMYLVGRNGLGIAATAGAKSSQPVWVLGGTVK